MPPENMGGIANQTELSNFRINCQEFNITALKEEKTYRNQHDLDYPVNVARNIARETANTHFVLSSGDVRLVI